MDSSNRPLARLGLALAAAVLGLATVTAVATADPTGTAPPPTSSAPSSESPPSEPPPPPSSESSVPPPSHKPVEKAAVEVTAKFQKPSYATGETIGVTVTVTNTDTATRRLDVLFPTYGKADGIQLNGVAPFGRDLRIGAGASVTGELTGVMLNPNVTRATLYVSLSGDVTKELEFSVPVTRRVATVSGIVHHDHNGISDARLTFTNKYDVFVNLTTSTNGNGEYTIEVTPGDYLVEVSAAGMLSVRDDVTVPESGVDGLSFGLKRALSGLSVDLEFTKNTYKPTETSKVRVALTNKGEQALTNIVARCVHDPDGPNLSGTTWGDLAGKGVTIAPNKTLVLEVTEPMPPKAHNYGYVAVDCGFTYAGVWTGIFPKDIDRAAVPGQSAEVTGQIQDSNGEADDLSGFHVVLTAEGGKCPIIAKAVTGKDGRFSLGRLPVGRYHYYIVPPPPGWSFRYSNHSDVPVIAGRDNHWGFLTWPSENNNAIVRPPNCPGGPGTNPPGPQGSAGPKGLAYTGASLVVPGIAGLVALLAGAATVFVTRRRKAPEED